MSDDDNEEIFRVDTVPPPPGESDAYSAPTKVGPMAAAVVGEMIHAAERKTAELRERAAEKLAASAQKSDAAAPKPVAPPRPDPVRPRSLSAPALSEPPAGVQSVPVPATRARPLSASTRPPGGRIEGASAYSLTAGDLVQDSGRSAPPSAPSPPAQVAPRMFDHSDDEDGNAETLLSKAAKPPVVAPIVPPPMAAPFDASTASRPTAATGRTSPFAFPRPAAPPPEPNFVLSRFLPMVVGVAIFLVGLALYFWAR